MPFNTNVGHVWDRNSIIGNAPNASGVYGIYRPNVWIYVGESNDIQRRLLEHFNIAGTCVWQNNPTGFIFEVVAGEQQRKARQNQLIAELRPVCVERMG